MRSAAKRGGGGWSTVDTPDCGELFIADDAGAWPEGARGAVLVIFEADEFHQVAAAGLEIRAQELPGELQLHRLRERAGILEREVVGDAAVVDPRPALDGVKLLGVRC